MRPFGNKFVTWLGRPAVLTVACGCALLLHAALVLCNFPPRAAQGRDPLSSRELAFHLAGAMEGHDFMAVRHRIWGYSPRYMAGYPFGVWNSIGTRGYESSSALFPWLSVGAAYYLWIVLTAFLPPLLVAWACRLLTRDRALAGVCLLAALLVYHLGNILGFYWSSGMIAFVLASAMAVLYGALLYRGVQDGSWAFALAAGAVAAGIVWINTLAVVPAALVTAAVAWAAGRAMFRVRTLVRLAAGLALAVLLLLPWLLVLWQFRDQRGYMDLSRIPSGMKYLVMDFLSDRRYLYHFDRRPLLHVLVVLAALGTWRARRDGDRAVAAFGLTALGLLACTYGFAYSRFFDQTEPYRYLASVELFAFVPAALGLREFARLAREANAAGRVALLCLGLILLPSLTAYALDLPYRWRNPISAPDPARQAVAAWLRERAAQPGRVLCEDKWLGNVLPYYTGQPVIGGTIGDESVLPQSWAGAGPRCAFGARCRAKAVAEGKLADDLRLYNIAFVVARSDAFARDMDRLGDVFGERAEVGGYRIFAVAPGRGGYVWDHEGAGGPQVVAGPNRIVVEPAPRGDFVLKFHYLRGLTAGAGVRLHPQPMLDDPVPFIGVSNAAGARRVEIELKY